VSSCIPIRSGPVLRADPQYRHGSEPRASGPNPHETFVEKCAIRPHELLIAHKRERNLKVQHNRAVFLAPRCRESSHLAKMRLEALARAAPQ
jgi:hypothetical protein